LLLTTEVWKESQIYPDTVLPSICSSHQTWSNCLWMFACLAVISCCSSMLWKDDENLSEDTHWNIQCHVSLFSVAINTWGWIMCNEKRFLFVCLFVFVYSAHSSGQFKIRQPYCSGLWWGPSGYIIT
jgi:hypothetical protein